jgi:hypothetical protein
VHQAIPPVVERPALLRYIVDSSVHLKTVLDLVGGVASVSFRKLTLRLPIETYRSQINPIASATVKALNGLLMVTHLIAACRLWFGVTYYWIVGPKLQRLRGGYDGSWGNHARLPVVPN